MAEPGSWQCHFCKVVYAPHVNTCQCQMVLPSPVPYTPVPTYPSLPGYVPSPTGLPTAEPWTKMVEYPKTVGVGAVSAKDILH